MTYYEKAIELSNKHCFLHEKTLSCERVALFLLRLGSIAAAKQLLRRACKCCERWSAESKKYQLIKEH